MTQPTPAPASPPSPSLSPSLTPSGASRARVPAASRAAASPPAVRGTGCGDREVHGIACVADIPVPDGPVACAMWRAPRATGKADR